MNIRYIVTHHAFLFAGMKAAGHQDDLVEQIKYALHANSNIEESKTHKEDVTSQTEHSEKEQSPDIDKNHSAKKDAKNTENIKSSNDQTEEDKNSSDKRKAKKKKHNISW